MIIQVLMLLCLAFPAWSQSTTGAILGNITDPAAAAVPQAKIAAIEQRTNLTAETVSDATGAYAFPALRPGVYRLEVEASGFRKAVRNGVEVRVNDRLELNIAMVLGAVSESVEVTAAAPLVESQSGAVGNVIENRKITDLPLNARNPFQLALLSPGVVPSPAFGNAFNSSAAFIINGNRANVSEMLIDGITNSVPAANPIVVVSLFPSPDALEEFKVQTNGYAAEFGRSGGGIINMVLKSGTNQYHGVVYEFFRNSRLDANDFFANRAGRSIPSFKRNQYGATLGGPIQRDKAFFFINYEGLRQRTRGQQAGTTPTAAERSGDFSQSSQLVAGRCTPVQIYDPFTTRANPAGGFLRDLLPNNTVPASRFDRVGSKIVTFFPTPNTAGAACTGINNFLSDKVASSDTNEVDAKLDWAPSSRNKFTLGLGYRTRLDLAPNHYGNIAATSILPGDSMPARSGRIEFNRTHSPTLLFQLRFGVTRLERHQDANVGPEFSLTELGFPSGLEQQMVRPLGFPVFTYAGYVGMGRGSQFLDQRGTSYMWVANATKIAGRHQWKAGIEYRVNQSMEGVGNDTSGTYSFDRTYTQGPNPTAPSVERGNPIASLLLGTPTSGGAGILPYVFTSNPYFALYLQDDYRVTNKLTLNLGVRWDLEKGRNERFNQLSFFDFNSTSPLAAQTSLPNLRGGLRFVGVDGNPRRQFDTDWNNIAPRFGFAYSLNEQTVFRGSYGIFNLPYIGAAAGWSSGINGFLSSTAMTASTDGLRPTDALSNPFPRGLQAPTAPSSGLLTNIGQDFGASGRDGAIDRSARVGYSQQWNFNIQRQLPGKLALEAAYVGNKGSKLTDGPLGPQLNQLAVEQMALGNQLLQTVPNPFQPFVRTGPLSQPRVTQAQLLRPYPQFLALYNFRPALGSSIYHGFQARAEKRYSSGLTLLASLTTGKLIEDTSQTVGFLGAAPTHQNVYNRRASRSLASQDISRRLVFSYVYDLPFGRGKSLASTMPKAIDAIVGHWQINGILTLSTGIPLAIATAQNNSQSFSATQYPNVNGSSAAIDGSRSTNDKLARWFDTSVFSQPAPFTFGSGPRVLPDVRADGTRSMDFSLFKDIPIREAMRVQFRAEFFNLTNTPNFAPPGQAFGNPAFGIVNAQFNTPRQLQLGLKFYY
ncbi:MAG: TonB-dependent receptor [Bryobacterales bacterium]|nr:TonB-dependent receptor [Bryobacterales bacterium]